MVSSRPFPMVPKGCPTKQNKTKQNKLKCVTIRDHIQTNK